MDRNREQEILQRYRQGRCSEAELKQLEAWYDNWNVQDRILLSEVQLEEAELQMRSHVMQRIGFDESPKRLWRNISIVASAAVVVIGLGVALYYNIKAPVAKEEVEIGYVNDIAPGKNRAILTLPSGEQVMLSEEKDAVLINATALKYTDGTQINSGAGEAAVGNTHNMLHRIATPKGGQYQIILSDGTKIWLNAASSIKFPSTFDGLKERRIEISGEAYLEVRKDMGRPFIVVSGAQEVEVLGTRFNINAYADDSFVQTTLLEGSVRIKPLQTGPLRATEKLLKPGQKSILSKHNITVQGANVNEVIAWKEGDFRFEDQTVPAIMKQIARWYAVEVVYVDDVSEVKLNASISRARNLSQVLKMMEKTGEIHFKIEGRNIIVTK